MFAKHPDNELRNALVITSIAGAAAIIALIFAFSNDQIDQFAVFRNAGIVIASLWWLVLPIPMWLVFFMIHGEYVGVLWVVRQKNILLEIKVPADVEKSPKLMQQVIVGYHDYTTLSRFEIYCGWRPLQNKLSFEIASLEGEVHFYIRCPARLKNAIEAQVYAHYPDAEVFEVEDYTKLVPKYLPNAEWDVWGVTLAQNKPDAYPIRTYKRFKEDITGKMIDPLASLIETMSTMGKGQYSWYQIIVTAAADPEWMPRAVAEMNKIMKIAEVEKLKGLQALTQGVGGILSNVFNGILGLEDAALAKPTSEKFNINYLTVMEQELLKAMVESLSELAYKSLVRYVYVARKESWDKPLGVGGILGSLKQARDVHLNSLLADSTTKTFAQYYFIEPRLLYRQRKILQNYKDRDYAGQSYYLTSEELATIYHYPDMSVKSPTVNRVEAKKGDAPANLPVEFDPNYE